MNIRTKFLTIVTILAVWSCSEKGIIPNNSENGLPIEFGNVSTRAMVTDINKFWVSCAISNTSNTAYGSIMENIEVTHNQQTNKWEYTDKRYWIDDTYYYFIGFYSSANNEGYQFNYGKIEDVDRVYYTLDVDTYNDDTHDQVGDDILTATKYAHTSDSWTTNVVNLQFRHLFTNINLEITKDKSDSENQYFITGVSLYGVSTNGTHYIMPGGDSFIESWDVESPKNTNSFDKVYENPVELEVSKPISVWEDTDGLLLLPQNISRASAHIRIDYNYLLKDDDPENDEEDTVEKYVIIDIPATDKWQSNSKITYTLSFANPNKIVFKNVSVESWGDAQNGGTIIIQ